MQRQEAKHRYQQKASKVERSTGRCQRRYRQRLTPLLVTDQGRRPILRRRL
jgi:hypothetical protein